MYNRAKKLHIEVDTKRVVYIAAVNGEKDATVTQLLKGMFSTESGDYVTEIDENNVVIIKSLADGYSQKELEQIAQSIVDTVSAEAMVDVRVGYGNVISITVEALQLWTEQMVANGAINMDKYNARRGK